MRGKKIGPVVAAVLAAQCLVAETAFAAPLTNQDPYDVRQLSVRDLGDLNGDGVSEVVIGKGWQDIARADEGAVFIVQRDSDCQLGDVVRITQGEAGLRLELQAGDRFGASIAPIGDLDGDGVVVWSSGFLAPMTAVGRMPEPCTSYSWPPTAVWPVNRRCPLPAEA